MERPNKNVLMHIRGRPDPRDNLRQMTAGARASGSAPADQHNRRDGKSWCGAGQRATVRLGKAPAADLYADAPRRPSRNAPGGYLRAPGLPALRHLPPPPASVLDLRGWRGLLAPRLEVLAYRVTLPDNSGRWSSAPPSARRGTASGQASDVPRRQPEPHRLPASQRANRRHRLGP
jgi:hypothetical protein